MTPTHETGPQLWSQGPESVGRTDSKGTASVWASADIEAKWEQHKARVSRQQSKNDLAEALAQAGRFYGQWLHDAEPGRLASEFVEEIWDNAEALNGTMAGIKKVLTDAITAGQKQPLFVLSGEAEGTVPVPAAEEYRRHRDEAELRGLERTERLRRQARRNVDLAEGGHSATVEHDGAAFLLAPDTETSCIWGEQGTADVWNEGESLMLFGPRGSAKSTLAQHLTLARLGIVSTVLEWPVAPSQGRVAYFALDRAEQIKRSFRKIARGLEATYPGLKTVLAERLIFVTEVDWLLTDPASRHKLREWCTAHGVDTVTIDSLKDAGAELSPENASGYNMTRQSTVNAGIQLVEVHHPRKVQVGNKKPDSLDDVAGGWQLTAGVGSAVYMADTGKDEQRPVIEWRVKRAAGTWPKPLSLRLDKDDMSLAKVDPMTLGGKEYESLVAELRANSAARPDMTQTALATLLREAGHGAKQATLMEAAKRYKTEGGDAQ